MVIDLGSCWVPADSDFISIVVPAGFLLNQKKNSAVGPAHAFEFLLLRQTYGHRLGFLLGSCKIRKKFCSGSCS